MSRIIFAGTPEFAAIHLRALIASGVMPVAVYTQPDRPAGRGQQLQKSPVKLVAEQFAIAVFQPEKLRDESTQQTLRDLAPDLLIVVAYGLILPQAVLTIPRLGCVNVHASLLPRWRGAAPIQRAIEAGDQCTGTALMQMESGLDTGPVLAHCTTPINDNDNSVTLHDRLAQLGANLLVQQLPALLTQSLTPQPQTETGVCYAHKIEKREAMIDWKRRAIDIDRQVRAFNPFPIASTLCAGEAIKIHQGYALTDKHHAIPGQIIAVTNDAVIVACGDGAFAIQIMQWPGGKKLSVHDLLHSKRQHLSVGNVFGDAP